MSKNGLKKSIRTPALDGVIDEPGREAFVDITTDGEKGVIGSRATIGFVEDCGEYTSTTHRVFQDFSVTISRESARATKAAIQRVHDSALARESEIIAAAHRHYGVDVPA